MAKKKSKPKTSDIIVTKAVTTTTKPKEKKPQTKIPAYESVIDAYLSNNDPQVIMGLIDAKFKGKDVSTGTVSEVRGELFSLMIYLENNEKYNREMKDLICKISENIVVEGSAIRYKLQ